MRCTPLFPRGACPHWSGPWHQDCLRSLLLEMTVLRPTSSLRKTRTRVCSGQIPMRHAWQELQAAGWPTKGTSRLRLASGVLRAASSVPWSGRPAGDGRSSCTRDPRRGDEPPSSATLLGGRDCEKRSLETAAPWNTGQG